MEKRGILGDFPVSTPAGQDRRQIREFGVSHGLGQLGRSECRQEVVELGEDVTVVVALAEKRQQLLEPTRGGWQRPSKDIARDVLSRGRGQPLQHRLLPQRA
jgi:hypothetical protein